MLQDAAKGDGINIGDALNLAILEEMIIDEGHFLGKALGEGMNGYRPIVELMNANFGIYGMAALVGGQHAMIRDDGPGILFTPVKLMKDAKVPCDVGTCMPLNKALVYAGPGRRR
ncbi:pyruvate dehydrogenase [Aureococcus anophagefferens]|nr:pyruvate dehydrogenase [Aureococcus anophagefferens]